MAASARGTLPAHAHLRNARKRAHTDTSHFCICQSGTYGTSSCGHVLAGALFRTPLPHALLTSWVVTVTMYTVLGPLHIHAALGLSQALIQRFPQLPTDL